ncbi:hypothetical protein HMPREF9440_00708 [Sutterella parvirubra YIT 11816]|uniref:Uncharacterized protein n=1 Tax=Sutterella parvirubra YIT 11816 TaxID=762967 RepID=H3KD99_9BURK|nr:hypothetical protein HMPREF9440_00708 [Sutterella parvirubra YIT 11816]
MRRRTVDRPGKRRYNPKPCWGALPSGRLHLSEIFRRGADTDNAALPHHTEPYGKGRPH